MYEHPEGLDADLIEQISAAAAQWHACTARLAETMAQVEATDRWAGPGLERFGHWASVFLGIRATTADEMVRTARRLGDLPLLAAAVADGRIGWEKAVRVAGVATPGRQADWLELAEHLTVNQLDRAVALYRRAGRPDPQPGEGETRDLHPEVNIHHLQPGWQRLVADLPADDMAILDAAIQAHLEADWRDRHPGSDDTAGSPGDDPGGPDPAPDRTISPAERRAAALVGVALTALDAGPRPVVAGEHQEVILHVDLEVLLGDDQGRSGLAGGTPLDPDTTRRLCCDARFRLMGHDAQGRPQALSDSHRLVDWRQRRLLTERDQGCVFPGCHARRYVDAHHVVPWPAGPTTLDNLALLCRRHHRLHHQGGFRISMHDGRPLCAWPDGTPLRPAPPPEPPDPAPVPTGRPLALAGGERRPIPYMVNALYDAQPS